MKSGATIGLMLRKADGTEKNFSFHNLLTNSYASSYTRASPAGTVRFYAFSNAYPINEIDGTWSLTHSSISRVSGSGVLPDVSEMIQFADGDVCYLRSRISDVLGDVSWTANYDAKPRADKPAQAIRSKAVAFNHNTALNRVAVLDLGSFSSSYSAGVNTLSLNNTAPKFAFTATAPVTIARLGAAPTTPNEFTGSTFELDTPIVMDVGDALFVTTWDFDIVFPDYLPTVFSAGESPLKGYRGSGTVQRLTPYNGVEQTATNPRLYFLSDANRINPIPAYQTTTIAGSSLTALATITPTARVAAGGTSNMMWNLCEFIGSTVGAVANVRQIAWGTTTQLYGVIEFDTLVSFAVNARISLMAGLYYAADLGVWEIPPTALTAPVASGTPEVGETLSVTNGTWISQQSLTYEYQWMRDGGPIIGATASTYLLVGDDADAMITCEVTAVNATGDESQVSNALGPVEDVSIPVSENTVAPTIGWELNPYEGYPQVLNNGTWTNTPTSYTYQWFKNTVLQGGQTTFEFTGALTTGDDIYCEVTAVNAGGNSLPEASNTMADYVIPAVATIYWTDTSDNEDSFVIQWGTDNITFPNEIIFPQPFGGSETGEREYECSFPGAGTYYARIVARGGAGDSAPGDTVTLTAV